MPQALHQELAEIVTRIPFNQILGLKLDSFENGHANLSFSMKKELIGNFLYGILHGGVISSVLDMAGGVAAMSAALSKHKEKNVDELKEIIGKASTVNLHVNYVQPGKGEHFVATASVVHAGKKLCFTRIELHNEEKKLIATGAGTYLIG